jgi:hypothetical protein
MICCISVYFQERNSHKKLHIQEINSLKKTILTRKKCSHKTMKKNNTFKKEMLLKRRYFQERNALNKANAFK